MPFLSPNEYAVLGSATASIRGACHEARRAPRQGRETSAVLDVNTEYDDRMRRAARP